MSDGGLRRKLNGSKVSGVLTEALGEGVDKNTIEEYQTIGVPEAIQRFLTRRTRNRIVDEKRYFLDPQDDAKRRENESFCLVGIRSHRDEFCRTEKGRLWYKSHIVDYSGIPVEGENLQ